MERGIIEIKAGRVIVRPVDGEIWMCCHEIARMFGCFISKVTSNVLSIYKAGHLHESATSKSIHCENGDSYRIYNLEMITALSFRIHSYEADLFRAWLMKRIISANSRKEIPVFISCVDPEMGIS